MLACIWASVLGTSIFGARPRLAVLMVASGLSVFIWLLLTGFTLNVAGVLTSWTPHLQQLVVSGGTHIISISSPLEIGVNEWHSLILNQSFTVTALVMVFIGCIVALQIPKNIFNKRNDSSNCTDSATQLAFIAASVILAMLMLSQLLLPYGFMYAVPEADTTNSRFSLPFAVLVIPAALCTFHACTVGKANK